MGTTPKVNCCKMPMAGKAQKAGRHASSARSCVAVLLGPVGCSQQRVKYNHSDHRQRGGCSRGQESVLATGGMARFTAVAARRQHSTACVHMLSKVLCVVHVAR